MGKILTVQKTIETQVVQINSPEEDAVVRAWLAEMFKAQIADITQEDAEALAGDQFLTPIVEAHGYFARDKGDSNIYIIPAPDLIKNYEEVSERELPSALDADVESAFKIEG